MIAPFKPFEEMTPADYAEVGLMCGLEVHRQLATGSKLFCRCPAGRFSGAYDAEILRHMRPTLSELGEYDGTALMEKKTRKNIYYRIHHKTVCTYEFDDTPPFFMDDEALDITLELCELFRLNVVNELHVARKQYLDGSIPTGFQRTAIVGVTGAIPYNDREIGIRQLSIEEDSCREVSDVGHDRVYLTDRLGMPLVEIVTEPDMKTPQEAAEVCQLIRKVCRSTGKVRTGYGAAREDVNVSVRGGTRVEIKGVPRIPRIPRLVYNEGMRQWSLLHIRDELRKRGIKPETFRYETHDVTRAVAKAHYDPIRKALDAGLRVKCVVLKGFAGILSVQTQEHTTFATEFSDRVRVIACLTRLPNIVHSDSASEALAARDWKELRRKTKADYNDAMILVWGDEGDTRTACEEIAIRAREATEGIPSDTRQALADGTNGFERVLPGAERMYPDTDLPPLEIAPARMERIRAGLPEDVWEREARYRSWRVPEDSLVSLLFSSRNEVFSRIVTELGVDARFAAVVIAQRMKAFGRAGMDSDSLSDDELFEIFKRYADGALSAEGVPLVIEHLLGPTAQVGADEGRVEAAIKRLRLEPANEEEVRAHLAQMLQDEDDGRFRTTEKKYTHYMGELMAVFVGRFPGRRLAEILGKQLGVAVAARNGGKVQA